MKVVNEKFETITEYDLTTGMLVPTTVVREDAKPIDNARKFAWDDDDYEDALMYIPNCGQPEVNTAQDDIDAMMIDHEYRLTLLELGLS